MTKADLSKLPSLTDLNGTLAERVYGAVKTAILSLDFEPGAVIQKAVICERLGVSRSPVSDALSKLSSEGLVDILPQSGTRVSRLSTTAVREGAFLREALEVAAARHAALNRSPEMLASLLRSIEMQKMLLADVAGDEFMKTDEAFHGTIMQTTNVARLPATVRSVSQHVDRARLLLVPEPGRLGETLEEHIAIVDAIERQDETAAQDAMRHHLRQLLRRLAPLEAARPDLFSS